MAFILQALHVPSQEIVTYGPWPASEDPDEARQRVGFAQGFVCGIYSMTHPDGQPNDLTFTVLHADDDTLPEPPPPAEPTNIVGHLVSEASASVVHADGSVD